MTKYLPFLTKSLNHLAVQRNGKDCVGDTPSLPQDSKVEPAIKEAVWMRHEGTMSESMTECNNHG